MPATSDELERSLCHELFSHDPFDITGPVSDDETFFGRRGEALDLARKLQHGQIRSCLGIRKIGKTSVLNRVIQEANRNHDCYCVMLDCSRDAVWSLRSNELMASLAEAILDAKSNPNRYSLVAGPKAMMSMSDSSAALLAQITSATKPILIFIDEVDYITPGSPTASHWIEDFNPFWRNFRAVYQEALRIKQPVSVMVCGVSGKWFGEGAINGIENAALAFIPEEYLSPLARAASVAMVRKIARTAGLVISEGIADFISAACSDMPFWVRKACSFVHRHLDVDNRPFSLDQNVARDLVGKFIEQEGSTLAQIALTHLFRVFPELEAPSLASITSAGAAESKYSTILRKYGVCDQSPKLQPSGEMIASALRSYRDERETAQAAVQRSLPLSLNIKDKSALDDWTENLAIMGKQRNQLEIQMRQLAARGRSPEFAAERL